MSDLQWTSFDLHSPSRARSKKICPSYKLIFLVYYWLNNQALSHLFFWDPPKTLGLKRIVILHRKELKNAFLSFVSIQVLIVLLNFNDFAFVCTVSRAHPSWPEGCYHTGRIFSNGFLILSIISDVTKKYSTRIVRKRKNPQYLDSMYGYNWIYLS